MNEPTPAPIRTAPLAIWSLVLALVGFACMGPFAAIPAVICGHLALPRIRDAAGRLQGQGLAIAGLVVGYVSIALWILILPMMLAILLPALGAARQAAQRMVCATNLREVGNAAQMYALGHQGNFPPDFQTLVQTGSMDRPKLFVCPATHHQPGALADVDQWTDYVLVPNRKSSDPGHSVLAFSKPECYPGKGGNILFVDGSVQWCNQEDYARLIAGAGPTQP
jgi:prepilin-type processing-associated H-X9-DG protein